MNNLNLKKEERTLLNDAMAYFYKDFTRDTDFMYFNNTFSVKDGTNILSIEDYYNSRTHMYNGCTTVIKALNTALTLITPNLVKYKSNFPQFFTVGYICTTIQNELDTYLESSEELYIYNELEKLGINDLINAINRTKNITRIQVILGNEPIELYDVEDLFGSDITLEKLARLNLKEWYCYVNEIDNGTLIGCNTVSGIFEAVNMVRITKAIVNNFSAYTYRELFPSFEILYPNAKGVRC